MNQTVVASQLLKNMKTQSASANGDQSNLNTGREWSYDVVVASNGSIWFTDPTYGIGGNYEGLKQTQEQDKHYVFRVDGKTSEIKPVRSDRTCVASPGPPPVMLKTMPNTRHSQTASRTSAMMNMVLRLGSVM